LYLELPHESRCGATGGVARPRAASNNSAHRTIDGVVHAAYTTAH
jgi:hypothetical protein